MSLGVHAHPDAVKAFNVNGDDIGAVIVWARHYREAKRVGANHLDSAYDDVECERLPELDGFTGTEGDLRRWMLDRGWWFSCQECETRCYEPECIIDERDNFFCSKACLDAHEAEWAPRRELEAKYRAFAEVKFFGYGVELWMVNVKNEALLWVHPLCVPQDPKRNERKLETLILSELTRSPP